MNKLITLITIFTFIFFGGFVYSQTNCESARKKYLELNPDVAKAGMDAWNHYTVFGKNEGRVWPQCASEVSNVNAGTNINSKTYPSCFYNNGNLSVFQLGNYEILFSNQEMTWYEVNDLCKKLGDDWYLPSRVAVIILVERLNFGNINKLWTSDESTSMPNGNYSGKTWTNADNDMAEALEFKSRETVSLYKSDKATFAIARCKGNNYDKVKSNLSSATNIGNIQVSTFELRDVTYLQAIALCEKLGEGWRLPTIEELEFIKSNGKNCEIDISPCFYWSTTPSCNGCADSYFSLSLNSGKRNLFDKYSKLRAIPVRKSESQSISKSYDTYKVGNLEVMKFDLINTNNNSSQFGSEEDFKFLNELGNGWRLPTIYELKTIYDNKSIGGNTFYDSKSGFWKLYWSSSQQNNLKFPGSNAEYGYTNSYWLMDFGNGRCYEPRGSYYIRAVR